MINKRITMSAFSIVTALSLMGGATYAYFTDSVTSQNNTFSTGTLDINISQNDPDPESFDNIESISNWAPGDSQLVEFNIQNAGSLPVHLRGFAAGAWTGTFPEAFTPDPNLVQVTRVQYRLNGAGTWTNLVGDGTTPLTGVFHFGTNGLETDLFNVTPGTQVNLRLTVLFDEDAGNEYQGKTYNAKVQVHAKQTNSTAWPAVTAVTLP